MVGDGREIEKRTQPPKEELAPSTLRLRLEALLQDAYIALPVLSEFHKTELVQSVIVPAQSLRADLEGETELHKGRTLLTVYLEERFDRKYRPKPSKKKGA